MNKSQQNMEPIVALLTIAYDIGLLIGEAIRDQLFAASVNRSQTPSTPASVYQPVLNKGQRMEALLGAVHPAQTEDPPVCS